MLVVPWLQAVGGCILSSNYGVVVLEWPAVLAQRHDVVVPSEITQTRKVMFESWDELAIDRAEAEGLSGAVDLARFCAIDFKESRGSVSGT